MRRKQNKTHLLDRRACSPSRSSESEMSKHRRPRALLAEEPVRQKRGRPVCAKFCHNFFPGPGLVPANSTSLVLCVLCLHVSAQIVRDTHSCTCFRFGVDSTQLYHNPVPPYKQYAALFAIPIARTISTASDIAHTRCFRFSTKVHTKIL